MRSPSTRPMRKNHPESHSRPRVVTERLRNCHSRPSSSARFRAAAARDIRCCCRAIRSRLVVRRETKGSFRARPRSPFKRSPANGCTRSCPAPPCRRRRSKRRRKRSCALVSLTRRGERRLPTSCSQVRCMVSVENVGAARRMWAQRGECGRGASGYRRPTVGLASPARR